MIGISSYYGPKAKWMGSGEEGRATKKGGPGRSANWGLESWAQLAFALDRALERRGSVTAASNRAAIASNSGFGPFQRSWSTLSKRGMSIRSAANVRKRIASPQCSRSVAANAPALVAFT